MDYQKINKFCNGLLAVAGCGLIWTSVYRLGFGEPLSDMPRAAYIVSSELLVMGVVMILCGTNIFNLGELVRILKLLIGKSLFCFFVAGFMDVMVYSFSNLVTIINLFIFGLGGFYLIMGLIFIIPEFLALISNRKDA